MSLPRYCINLMDLVDMVAGVIPNLTPSEFKYEFGCQRSKGFKINFDEGNVGYASIKIPYEDYIITGLNMGVTSLNENYDMTNSRHDDYFHFIVNGEKIFDNIYMKEISSYKNFRAPMKVASEMIEEGLDMQIAYHNNDIEVPVEVWFDIDYYAEPKLTSVTISYVDTNGDEIKPSKTRQVSEGKMRIMCKDIDDYYVVGDYFEDIEVVYGTPIKIEFMYTDLKDVN